MSAQEVEVIERPARFYQDYSTERKAEVLALVQANAGNVLQTSRETGIPHQTIRLWLAIPDRFSSLENQKHSELDQKLNNTVHKLIDSIHDHDLTDVPLQAKSTAFGVVFDKLQLLRGLPTSISESIERQELTILLGNALSEVIDITPDRSDSESV